MTNQEREKRIQSLFFEAAGLEKPPELAKPEEALEGDDEEVEAFIFAAVGAVVGGVIGGVATAATGIALVASIAQGVAIGYAIGSMIDQLTSSGSKGSEDPQKLPDPTYSFNTAGSEGLAKRGGVIPLVYTSKTLNQKGGVRYMGELIYSKMVNKDSSGVLKQVYALGNASIIGNVQKPFEDSLLVNGRLAEDQFFSGERGSDDEVKIKFLRNAQSGLSFPYYKEYSQAISPSQFQKFGYKFITEVDQPWSENGVTRRLIKLPDDDYDEEVNKYMIYRFSPRFLYGLAQVRNFSNPTFYEFRIDGINYPGDNPAYRVWANHSIKQNDTDKILELHKFYYSTTKMVNRVDFNFDYTLFGKEITP